MANRVNLTKSLVARIAPPESGRLWTYDEQVRALAIVVTAAGSRSWYIYRKVHGKPERVLLGKWPDLTVEQARKLAAVHVGDIAKGINPNDEKRKARGELTLGELFALYLELHAEPHKKPRSVAEDRGLWSRYLEPWKDRKLSAVEPRDVQRLHKDVGLRHGKTAANRMLALLSKMFNLATDHGEWKTLNPCRGVKTFREKSRDRFLAADEIPRLLAALDADPNRDMRDFFRLLLLTGSRKGNLLSARWEDLHLDRGEWHLPDTKNNEPQTVYLPPEAVGILRARREAADEGETWIFPARTAGTNTGHMTFVAKAWSRITKAAGLDDLRIHDLRRTLGSWQAATGASLPVIGKSLGHRSTAATAIYARLDLDPVRKSVDTAVAAMLATLPNEKGGEHGPQEG